MELERKTHENCKKKMNNFARVFYHLSIVVYLITLLFERYQWDIYGRIGLFQIGIQLKPLIHILLTALLIEKIIRKGKNAIWSVILVIAAWIVG